jgi:DHA2 family multidrug resistance protein-like MFS transporter
MAAGAALMAVGLALLSTVSADTPPLVVALVVAVFQFGVAPLVTLGNNMVLSAAPPEATGQASGTSQTLNELGGALGIAVLGSVLQSVYRGHLDVHGLPPAAATHARSSLAVAAHLGPQVLDSARHAFVDGLQYALLGGAAALVLAAAAVLALYRTQDSR